MVLPAKTSSEKNGLPSNSVQASSLAESVRTLSRFPKAGAESAAAAAERVFACYPQQTPNRPKEYMAAVISLLAEYPPEILAEVCDPRKGIATKCKFLPTIAEFTEALEVAMERPRRLWQQEYEKRKALPRYTPPKRTPEEIEEVRRIASSWSKQA